MDALRYDLTYAARAVRRHPMQALIAALSLAIGIGALTSIVSIAERLLRQPMRGVTAPERMVEVWRIDRDNALDSFSYPDFVDLKEERSAFSGLAAFMFQSASVSVGAEGRRLMGMAVSSSYFPVLGVRAALGRTLRSDEDLVPGGNPVAVISHRLWTTMFNSDPAIIGRPITLSRVPFEVVGVAPPGFHGHIIAVQPDFWVPVTMGPTITREDTDLFTNRASLNYLVVGRLAEGVPLERAEAAAQVVMSRLASEYPQTNAERGARVTKAGPVPAAGRTPVAMLTVAIAGLVGLILLTICSNVGGMLLARVALREKETAVRVALGAPRARLARQLLFEALIIFALGGAGGLLVAHWGLTALRAVRLPIPIDVVLDFTPDLGVLLTGFGIAVVAGLVFGLVPALQASHPGIAAALKDRGNAGGARTRRSRRVFVALQVAASVIMMTAAGLFLRALQHAGTIPLGFTSRAVYASSLNLSLEGYPEAEGQQYFVRLLERLGAVPGVTGVAMGRDLPLDLGASTVSIVPDDWTSRGDSSVKVDFNAVSPAYFEVLAIDVLRGRAFTEGDTPEAIPVMAVDRTFAARVWPDGDALGRRVRLQGDTMWRTIVGVVDHVPNQLLSETPRPLAYVPQAQDYQGAAQVIVRGPPSPGTAASIRAAILELDPEVSVTPVVSLEDYTSIATLPQRAAAMVTGALGGLALALCALGLYGIVAHDVARRTREIGVRIAIGASRVDVTRLVVRGAIGMILPGLAAGALCALGFARVLGRFLLGLSPLDPLAPSVAVAVLLGAVAAAIVLPTRRAVRIPPMVALRSE